MDSTQNKVIISCAVTGSVHTPSMSPYLPLTPDAIAQQAIEAAQAGAAILHLHARNPADGSPTADPAVFDQFVPRIRAATDAVINITTGGSTRMTLEERLAYPLKAQPEMCSLNMGSMNFSIHPAARKIHDWRHDWEKPYIEGLEDL
ncbi:MAG: 3-keto-5-aminohexanoate cleavage protein, partial [Acidovorax sp.]|uniref:3-keto-5-aminohexanoate cleavage protein n=1 Tax=Acidovorax sp. TaxID=1872122 RepID=UPI00391A5842